MMEIGREGVSERKTQIHTYIQMKERGQVVGKCSFFTFILFQALWLDGDSNEYT